MAAPRDRDQRRRPTDRIDREESRPSRDDPRAARDDPRAARDDPRAARDDPRAARDDPRGTRDDPRGSRIPGLGEYFLPGDGIDRQVLQVELCKFLGSEAIARPGEYKGQKGYLIRAVRPFTPAMVRSLKESSQEYRSEVRDLRMQDYEVPYQSSGTYRDQETRRRQDPSQMSPNPMSMDDSPYPYQSSSSRAPMQGGPYSSASDYPSRIAPASNTLYSSGPGYPKLGFAPVQPGYPVTTMGGAYNDTDYIPVAAGDYPVSGGSHQAQSSYMQSAYGYAGPPPGVSSGRGNPQDESYMYYDPATGLPLSASNAGGYASASSAAREPRTIPGYDPRSQPGYDPRSSPGYDPRTQPGYDSRTQPGYDPRAQPGYDPRPDQSVRETTNVVDIEAKTLMNV
ncbi:hypothetical protein LPUS_03772 [Lasallia pustulata]|uniref:Transcription factor RfeG n=1 Tax=Lasallia pustulata TaxID=136370 RepID=A0A1W5CVL1_9LECA|nr:hypothetical protein LPUS_03772 [Lasallia pustulata]